jgi:hypothetical protein
MSGTKNTITFRSEIKEVNSKKNASLDVTYKVVLHTDDSTVLALGTLPGDQEVTVTIDAGASA